MQPLLFQMDILSPPARPLLTLQSFTSLLISSHGSLDGAGSSSYPKHENKAAHPSLSHQCAQSSLGFGSSSRASQLTNDPTPPLGSEVLLSQTTTSTNWQHSQLSSCLFLLRLNHDCLQIPNNRLISSGCLCSTNFDQLILPPQHAAAKSTKAAHKSFTKYCPSFRRYCPYARFRHFTA
jgi:hypothetical protein